MQIVSTKQVSLAGKQRSGYASSIGPMLGKMEPGQSLLVDVDLSEVQALPDEAALTAYATANEIKVRAGEPVHTAISRWLASRQRTRIMAALDLDKQKHYFRSQLVEPSEGVYTQIAIVCEPAANKPQRKPRAKKGEGQGKKAAASK